jgi:hypothetical protein
LLIGKGRFFKYLRKALYCEPFSELSQIDAGFMPASTEGNLLKFRVIIGNQLRVACFSTKKVRTNSVRKISFVRKNPKRTNKDHLGFGPI